MKLNQDKHENILASTSEISQIHHLKEKKLEKESYYDVPIKLLFKNNKNEEFTSKDHLNDPDIFKYEKKLSKIPKGVYEDYQQRKELGIIAPNGYFKEKIKQVELTFKRNQRNQNYDISGKYMVDYINDRNKAFNRRLQKYYGEFTKDLKISYERGGTV